MTLYQSNSTNCTQCVQDSNTPGLKPPNSVAKVFWHTVSTHASLSGSSVWLMTSNLYRKWFVKCERGGELWDMQLQVFYRSSACPSSAPRSHWSEQKCACEWACLRFPTCEYCQICVLKVGHVILMPANDREGEQGRAVVCVYLFICAV